MKNDGKDQTKPCGMDIIEAGREAVFICFIAKFQFLYGAIKRHE
jgi:hypothetical protein